MKNRVVDDDSGESKEADKMADVGNFNCGQTRVTSTRRIAISSKRQNYTTSLQLGTKMCRYNWHSAVSLRWPFPMLKY